MSKWTEFLTKFYNETKKSNPDYKLKDAMKDAASEYKKIKGTSKQSSTKKVSKKSRSKTMKKSRGGTEDEQSTDEIPATPVSNTPATATEDSSDKAKEIQEPYVTTLEGGRKKSGKKKGGAIDMTKPGDPLSSFIKK